VFSYVWTAVGIFIVVTNTWVSTYDPELRAQWVPWWASVLLLVGICTIGYVAGKISSWYIRRLTGRRPWQKKPSSN
jgi:hypothetical protein